LSIPAEIQNLHLKPLLHKQSLKVNKWVKNSLRAKTRLDFDEFMLHDKSFIDKNSLQYRELQKDLAIKNDIRSKLNENGGFLDRSMHAFELTETKILKDLSAKFQLPRHTLVPTFKFDHTEEFLRNLDCKKLQEDILREQERLEKAMREGKMKKYLKWKKIKEDIKGTVSTVEET
jgi:hypothetical protein